MGLDLFEPVADVAECLFFSAVVDEYDSHGSFVVSLRDCSKALLSSGVPDLQFDSLIFDLDCFDFEVDACQFVNTVELFAAYL